MSSNGKKKKLSEIAKAAITKHENSHMEMGMYFTKEACFDFWKNAGDFERFVKIGRHVQNLLICPEENGGSSKNDDVFIEKSLELLVQECNILSNTFKLQKVRFGRTEIKLTPLTLGGMRFQQAWGTKIQQINDGVEADCQDNLIRIIRRAVLDFGINHIETARGYGSSELQLGVALRYLFERNEIQRKDIILQTKVAPKSNPQDFRKDLETSFRNLQVEYIDLLSLHGLGIPIHYKWVFGKENNENNDSTKDDDSKDDNKDTSTTNKEETIWDILQEYKRAGKIRHIGFSSHGRQYNIRRFIETNLFDYANLHYHFCGSYTTTAVGKDQREGNLTNLQLCQKFDMGVFIISAYDKGGMVYQPSNKLRRLTLPDLEPMAFGSSWLWTHHLQTLESSKSHLHVHYSTTTQNENGENGDTNNNKKQKLQAPPIHTIVVGAARPSDLDQGAVACYLYQQSPQLILTKVENIVERLQKAQTNAGIDNQWRQICFSQIPNADTSPHAVEHNQIIWCYNLIQAYGMLDFAKARYRAIQQNRSKWIPNLDKETNISKIPSWHWVPGLSIDPSVDYSNEFKHITDNDLRQKLLDAEAFVHKWCKKPPEDDKKDDNKNDDAKKDEKNDDEPKVPWEWQAAVTMKTWPDFPDRP